jgi:protein subunit release factor A
MMSESGLLAKLDAIRRRREEVELKLSDPKVIGDMKVFKQFNKKLGNEHMLI